MSAEIMSAGLIASMNPTKTNHDLKVSTLKGWLEQLKGAKIVKVIGKNRNVNVTVRTKS